MKLHLCVFAATLILLLILPAALGHGPAAPAEPAAAAGNVGADTVLVAGAAYTIIVLSVIASLIMKKKARRLKTLLFLFIAAPALLATAYITTTTVQLNLNSATGGPVHWHADIEVWHCGEQVELADPPGFSNTIGTPAVHEHNDNRIHIEGVLRSMEEADLHSFIDAIGGALSDTSLRLPTAHGMLSVRNGDLCGSQPATLQAFLYRIVNADATRKSGFVVVQEKLAEPAEYIPAPYSLVPPGDCLIIEFDAEKPSTDRLCSSYERALEKGELTYGR